MKPLGTILPTKELLDQIYAFAEALYKKQRRIGNSIPGCAARWEQAEWRYYRDARHYAIVDRSLKVCWWEKRADGYYWPIKGTPNQN